jgi:hypothetical protein
MTSSAPILGGAAVGGNGTFVQVPDLFLCLTLTLGAILWPVSKSFIFMGIALHSAGAQELNVTIRDEP